MAAILRVLERDDAHNGGMSLAEIAQQVGMSRSSVHRILRELEEQRFVARAPGTQRGYYIGPDLIRLVRLNEARRALDGHKYIQHLADQLDETSALAVMASDHMVFVDEVVVKHDIHAISALRMAVPLHSAAGMAVLAEMPRPMAERIIPEQFEKLTPKTPTREALLDYLEEVRQTGVAIDRETIFPHITSMGVALPREMMVRGSLIVAGITDRFLEKEDEVVAELLAVKARVSEELRGGLPALVAEPRTA
jgi:IclR family acetate operon transcriptional repressor